MTRIVIAAPLSGGEIGGPAGYALGLSTALKKDMAVSVVPFGSARTLPSGVRHLVYFFKLFFKSWGSDVIIALDMFSVGFPAVCVGYIRRMPVIIRTGGDFLWESYVERTGEKILFSDFYTAARTYTLKEKIIFFLTRFTLRHATHVIFSTEYQRHIFIEAYGLQTSRTSIIENRYYAAQKSSAPAHKNFVCFVRNLKWKNLDTLREAFAAAHAIVPDISLEIAHNLPHEELLQRLASCYAVILVSLGDISPNVVLEAMQFGKPVILTTETGIKDRLKDVAYFVNPRDGEAIRDAIIELSHEDAYRARKHIAESWSYSHSYDDITQEFRSLIKNVCTS